MSASESWVCEAQLGSGGFGIVHVWKNVHTGRKVALKRCKFSSDVTMTARHKAQWCQEVRICLWHIRLKREDGQDFWGCFGSIWVLVTLPFASSRVET